MKKNNNIYIWWFFLIIYLELIYKIFVLKNLFSFSTLSVLIFCLPVIIILSLLTGIFSNKLNRIINIVLSSFLTIVYLAQIVYYNFYFSMFSFFSLLAGGTNQVMQFWTMIIEVILRIWYIFVLVIIPFIFCIIYRKKLFNYNKIKSVKKYIYSLLISIVFIIMIIIFDSGLYSTKTLLFKTHSPFLTINKIGLINMEILDFSRYIVNYKESIPNIEDNSKEYSIKDYNVMNINFNYKDKNMNNYFKSIKPTNKNKYTGLLKNKNVILINTESFDKIAIDKDLTPTLYKLYTEGINFNNYYQPLYPISTFDGEFFVLTSLIPKEGTWSLERVSHNSMPFEFANTFNKNGYSVYAFHDNDYSFYSRDKVHKRLGFNYVACGNGLETKMNCKSFPSSDNDMIKSSLDYFIDKDKFAVYYMTVSGHLNYNFRENNISKKNKDKVKDLKYSNKIKSYLATGIEVDKALETLINALNEKNKLDDTLIVLTPDHYPYGLTCEELNEIDKNNRCDKFELYHTSLIMYNSKLNKQVINNKVSGIDILPTIYNLLGIEYDSRLLMGRDMFSDEEHLILLSDRSWISDYGTYNSLTKKFKLYKNKTVDKDYVSKVNKIVSERFSMSSLIIENDYYKYLEYNNEN